MARSTKKCSRGKHGVRSHSRKGISRKVKSHCRKSKKHARKTPKRSGSHKKRRCTPRRKINSVCKGVDTSICLSNNKCKLRSRKGKQYCSQISRKPRKGCRRASRRSGSRKVKRCPKGSKKVYAVLKNGKKSRARYTCASSVAPSSSAASPSAASPSVAKVSSKRAYYDKLNEEMKDYNLPGTLGFRVKGSMRSRR